MAYTLKDHIWLPKLKTIVIIDNTILSGTSYVEIIGNHRTVTFPGLGLFERWQEIVTSFSDVHKKIVNQKLPLIVWYYYNSSYEDIKVIVISSRSSAQSITKDDILRFTNDL